MLENWGLSCHSDIVVKERLFFSIEIKDFFFLFISSKQIEQLKQKADKRVRSVSNSFAMILIPLFCQARQFYVVFKNCL